MTTAKPIAKPTSGPWRVIETRGRYEIATGEDDVLAEVWGDDNDPQCWPISANARLIAAAPDLLQTIRDIQHNARVMNQAEPNQVWSAIDDLCQSAIAKATP